MKRVALVLCAVALAAVSVLAADVSGTWNVDGDVMGNPVKFPCVLNRTATPSREPRRSRTRTYR